jgi:hypothetical protein
VFLVLLSLSCQIWDDCRSAVGRFSGVDQKDSSTTKSTLLCDTSSNVVKFSFMVTFLRTFLRGRGSLLK